LKLFQSAGPAQGKERLAQNDPLAKLGKGSTNDFHRPGGVHAGKLWRTDQKICGGRNEGGNEARRDEIVRSKKGAEKELKDVGKTERKTSDRHKPGWEVRDHWRGAKEVCRIRIRRKGLLKERKKVRAELKK